ncbi:MAG: hypothetical protein F6J97_18255 [Leptolyngbya sp. SIO4C1]|nr:hypothetical protein [Leptolyngbya sp. SIO4C1]
MAAAGLQTQDEILNAYKQLSIGERLTLLWLVYQRVGNSIAPDIPDTAYSQVGYRLCQQVEQLDQNTQYEVMQDMLAGHQTRFSNEYSGLKGNHRLAFWYDVAKSLQRKNIAPVSTEGSDELRSLLQSIESLDAETQVELLRQMVAC